MESYRGIIPRPFKVDHQEWIKEQQGTKEEYATANLSVTRREDGIHWRSITTVVKLFRDIVKLFVE